jgi:hypothetical protein
MVKHFGKFPSIKECCGVQSIKKTSLHFFPRMQRWRQCPEKPLDDNERFEFSSLWSASKGLQTNITSPDGVLLLKCRNQMKIFRHYLPPGIVSDIPAYFDLECPAAHSSVSFFKA